MVLDAIYILDARPSKDKKFVDFAGQEIGKYFTGRKANFSNNQIHIGHCYSLERNVTYYDDKKKKWGAHGKSHIRSLAKINDVEFSKDEIASFLKSKMSESQLEAEVKKIIEKMTVKTDILDGKGGTKSAFSVPTEERCMDVVAGRLGLYETEKKPTWMIQFLAQRPGRQVDGFVDFLKSVEVNDADELSDFSKLFVETGILGVYKQVALAPANP